MYNCLKIFTWKIKIRCCEKGQLENKRAHGNYICIYVYICITCICIYICQYVYTDKYIYLIREDKVKEISNKGKEIENKREKYDKDDPQALQKLTIRVLKVENRT